MTTALRAFAIANMVEPALAAWLIQRWKADGFVSVRAASGFIAAACTAPVVGAAIGALATTVYVSQLPYLVTAGQWVIGDALGILTVVPFGLLLFGRLPIGHLRSIEGLAAILTVTLTALLVFGLGATNPLLAGKYLVLIPILWAATRFGIAGAAVSHELRTPLTAIMGFSEVLLHRSGELDDRSRQAAGVIHGTGEHLTTLVEQLLQVSHARGTTLPVDLQVIALRPLLEGLVTRRRDDPIALDGILSDVGVIADPFHLTQIITNLLDNALRHGAPPVEVSVRTDRGHTEVSIADHGQGVPVWFRPRLFDAFSQAVNGDHRGTLGLGLGLPISRTLAEANGGHLYHRDTRRQGACFVLRLPTATVDVGIT